MKRYFCRLCKETCHWRMFHMVIKGHWQMLGFSNTKEDYARLNSYFEEMEF